ncbi:gliding motility-associated C-terminal domain-containing protein [Mangrovibacterium sp.]|uniref:T9SS type B sorting domain-containing protein n=1 Tax=Mangrovibacterium sp. TaxID=1961364 RepID=UPI0035616733
MKCPISVVLIVMFSIFAGQVQAQISASADGQTTTAYAAPPQDNIYVFCSAQGVAAGTLSAQFSTGAPAVFEWLRYNSAAATFDSYESDNSNSTSSTISNLPDGCYRVNVLSSGVTEVYTAWVFNSYYEVTASITESTCDYFQLEGAFTESNLTYIDLATGSSLQVYKNVRVKWERGADQLSSVISPRIYTPPSENATYKLVVYDDFDCSAEAEVYYESIVPTAAFSASPVEGDAPLEVVFTNQSLNADEYEWFFFRDIDEIREEAASQGEVSDSIMDISIDQSPVYTFENSGQYKVKMVATKNSSTAVCRDTVYLDDYIVADTSFVDAPNFFTPGGDGANDKFIIKYTSMKSIDIKIFNRWGKQIFSVSRSNLEGYDAVGDDLGWDGKINGRYASPGVYYYVVEGRGRDDRKRKKQGFFHLFRKM